ncbi:MAG: hypothetical protein OWU84_05780 [Firmicutes bacterium]|nr:hypothetical protein [Bacillota bacterium]
MRQIEAVWIYHHSHLDVGYTEHPSLVWAHQADYLREAMALAEKYQDGPEGERFKWVAESSAVVERFLDTASKDEVDRFLRLSQQGLVETTALFCNMTPLFTPPELYRSLRTMERLRAQYGLPITTAINHDVNGVPWMLPDLLAAHGISFFLMGINADSARPPLPRPRAFLWEGYGGAQVTTYNGEHYGFAQYVGIPRPVAWRASTRNLRDSHRLLSEYVAKLEREGYPHAVLVLSVTNTVTWDNDGPNEELVHFVRAWNAEGLQPRLRIVTLRDIADYFQSQRPELPVLRGDWTDWWSHGIASTARETALKQWAERVWEAATLLRALVPRLTPEDAQEFSALEPHVIRQLLLYDEHTWGSAESISAPDAVHSLGQWHAKAHYAYEAAAQAQRLWQLAVRTLAQTAVGPDVGLLLANPLPHPVKTRVLLPKLRGPDDFGGAWPLHELARDLEMANPVSPLYVAGSPVDYGLVEIPAGGYRTLALEPPPRQSRVRLDRWTMQNAWWDLRIHPQRGAIVELRSRSDGYQWCDSESPLGLGEYLAHELVQPQGRAYLQPGTPAHDIRPDLDIREARVQRVIDYQAIPGPRLGTLKLRLEAPPLRSLEVSYTLYDDEPWIDLTVTVDRDDSRALSSLYFAFPFRFADPVTFHYRQGGAIIQGDEEQLPNSCRDYYAVEDFAALATPDRHALLLTPDAPLVLWGGFTVGAYQSRHAAAQPWLISWIMNNYWHTNFKADQSGPVTFQYRLLLQSGPFRADVALAHARAFALPLLAYPLLRGAAGHLETSRPLEAPDAASYLACDAPGLRLLQCEVLDDAPPYRRLRLVLWSETAVPAAHLQFGGGWQLRQAALVDRQGQRREVLAPHANGLTLTTTAGSLSILECEVSRVAPPLGPSQPNASSQPS